MPHVSDLLERWLREPGPRTLGDLIDRFGERSFALIFIVLMAVPALPLPTGGVTHVFEAVAMLVALAGRRAALDLAAAALEADRPARPGGGALDGNARQARPVA